MITVRQPSGKRVGQVRALTEIARVLTYVVSIDEVLRLTVERAAAVLESERVILMLSQGDGLLAVRACFGVDEGAAERFRAPLDETLARRVQGLLDVPPEGFLGAPLVVAGSVTGVLAVALRPDSPRTDEEEWLLSVLADQAAIAFEKTRLDEAAQFRERLIGMVSHDLRSPLHAVLLGVSAIEEQADLSDQTARALLRIRASAERAERMIHDLLDYTQAHLGGQISLQKRHADLAAIARAVLEQTTSVEDGARVRVVERGDARGEWDADRMAQVVDNLLSNALRYSAEGTAIEISIDGDRTSVTLAVHSLGPGIPRDKLGTIFEPFRRANLGPDSGSRSVGLGLYIVRYVVRSHGGSVTVTSTDEDGTTFVVRVPRRT